MDFFKSVFSDDPDPTSNLSKSESPEKEEEKEDEEEDDDPHSDSSSNAQNSNPNPNPNPNSPLGSGGGWSFGGLIKTLSSKSESVIETYRHDLKEFGSGLKKETATFKEVANRAVKELPTSIEAGASAAQGSLETVGQAIDEFGSSVWRGTAEIISQGKDTLLTLDHETEPFDNQKNYNNQNNNLKQYNRFDERVRAIQSNLSTYCEEPEDLNDYIKWKLGFVLEEKEVERLFEENGAIRGIYERIVPNEIDSDTFWRRYCYRVYKLKQAEDLRVNLVKRAISMEDEEDLSWDVDDDDDKDGDGDVSLKAELSENRELGGIDSLRIVKEENSNSHSVDELRVGDSGIVDGKRVNRSKPNLEDLGWEVENADEETSSLRKVDSSEKEELGSKDCSQIVVEVASSIEESRIRSSGDGGGDVDVGKGIVAESSSYNVSNEKMQLGQTSEVKNDELVSNYDEKMVHEKRAESSESCKDNDFTVVSSQPSLPEEEDLGWDEIEDLGSSDEKKVTHDERSPNRADLQKRLSAAYDEEDLNWDIEDDDEDEEEEPIKKLDSKK